MSWKSILKNVIVQNRVKEIEDIDIDIEDDDCLRWLNKLYNIILRHPESQVLFDEINDEEDACKVKALWEDKINFYFDFESGNTEGSMEYICKNRSLGVVRLKLFNIPSDDGDALGITLDSAALVVLDEPQNFNQKTAYFLSRDREKISKVLKEICNYVNISYDKMTEGIL